MYIDITPIVLNICTYVLIWAKNDKNLNFEIEFATPRHFLNPIFGAEMNSECLKPWEKPRLPTLFRYLLNLHNPNKHPVVDPREAGRAQAPPPEMSEPQK